MPTPSEEDPAEVRKRLLRVLAELIGDAVNEHRATQHDLALRTQLERPFRRTPSRQFPAFPPAA